MLFAQFLLPVGDNAADDFLIVAAKRFQLLHGNYSRYGFYHPGPWFLFIAGLGERIFYDWSGLFVSYFAAQTFAAALSYAIALALCCRLWLLVTGRIDLALLAVLLIIATIAAPMLPETPFLHLWTPFSTVSAAVLAATGMAGMVLRGPSWLPMLVLGAAQMVHGHAEFLGVIPMILITGAIAAFILRRLPLALLTRSGLAAWGRHHRDIVLLSLGIAALFATPILLDVILDWPGQFGAYLDFIGGLVPQPLGAAWSYETLFVPLQGCWLLLFLLPAGSGPMNGGVRAAGLIVLLAGTLPAFWAAWRIVGEGRQHYLLLWVSPFIGTALVAASVHAIRSPWLKPGAGLVLALALVVFALTVLSRMKLVEHAKMPHNLAMQRAVARLLAEPALLPGERIELSLDRTGAIWVPAWVETAEMMAALNRAGRHDFCVSPFTWHLLFGVANRCDPERDHITRHLIVTSWARIDSPAAFRFDDTGMAAPSGLPIGQKMSVQNLMTAGLELGPGWSGMEPDGVWSDQPLALIRFPAAGLPEHSRLTLYGTLEAPLHQQQVIHLLDAQGRELGRIEGDTGPAVINLDLTRPVGTEPIMLTLIVDHPITPKDLGINTDTRKLGFKLAALSLDAIR